MSLRNLVSAHALTLSTFLLVANSSWGISINSALPVSQSNASSSSTPVIDSVSIINLNNPGTNCQTLQVTITGENFNLLAAPLSILANGIPLQNVYANGDMMFGTLPAGFVSKPGALSFQVTSVYSLATKSKPFAYPASAQPILAVCANPASTYGPPLIYSGSKFVIDVQPTQVNLAGTPTLTLSGLPNGITTSTTKFSLTPTGIAIILSAPASVALGTHSITLNASDGTVSEPGSFEFQLVAGSAPPFYFQFQQVGTTEIEIPAGGSTQTIFGTTAGGLQIPDFQVVPAIEGLPKGVSVSFSPSLVFPGQYFTATFSAASNASPSQNAIVTLTGRATVRTSVSSAQFLVDVTPRGPLPGSRTDFVSTNGTPYAAAYDRVHELIFSSNPDWNRVDVISNRTHKLIKIIPVRSPLGIDVTPNDEFVWVQTGSQNLYRINTSTFQAQAFSLPVHKFGSTGNFPLPGRDSLFALADGTLFLRYNEFNQQNPPVAVWNPKTNALNVLPGTKESIWGRPARSGDGTRVYAAYGSEIVVYQTATQSISRIGGGNEDVIAVNQDGSRFVALSRVSLTVYDNNFKRVGNLPGFSADRGNTAVGAAFSQDGSKIYVNGNLGYLTVLLTVDAQTLKVLATAPYTSTGQLSNVLGLSDPSAFAADASGMLLSRQTYGIAFDDAAFVQNYAPSLQGAGDLGPIFDPLMGPLSGGSAFSLSSSSSLIPDVWYGQTRGKVTFDGENLNFTSPRGAAPGPVNLKFNFADGTQTFDPLAFTYSTFPEYVLTSGSAPSGGVASSVIGYGLPQDASGGDVRVGGRLATITTKAGQYPPLSGEPYLSTQIDFTLPGGTPGWADLEVTTPDGSATLTQSVFYAQSVTEYKSSAPFTALLYDFARNQVYLSAGNRIDVFSTTSHKFLASIYPTAIGSKKQFAGMALAPDGSQLLATDLTDGSLAVVDLEDPTSTFAISIAPVTNLGQYCTVGPVYVAASSDGQAFVTTGSTPSYWCSPQGKTYVVDLATHAVAPSPCSSGFAVDASADGSLVAIGGGSCVYSVQTASYTTEPFPTIPDTTVFYYGIAISGDGNVVGQFPYLDDTTGDLLGSVAFPYPYYANRNGYTSGVIPPQPLYYPRLNAAGSLYYTAYPNSFEIYDVAHGLLRMRIGLTQTVENTIAPMAIDPDGRYIYLITAEGLTEVDLGSAPLSIGHLSEQTAAPGAQVQVRGSGFESGMTATVGKKNAAVSVIDENTLTLTVPATSTGPQDIVLTRSDGEIYTLDSGILVQ